MDGGHRGVPAADEVLATDEVLISGTVPAAETVVPTEGALVPVRYILAVAVLGAVCVVWAAVPLKGTGAPGVILLVVATTCVAAGLLRLVRKDTGQGERYVFPGPLTRLALSANDLLLRAGWETGAVVAIVVLEAVHPSRPWHTGLLAIGVVAYLLAVHRAESVVPAAVFRGQTRVVLTSLALVVVATAVATIPSGAAQSGWLEILAALAAMTAGALALPL